MSGHVSLQDLVYFGTAWQLLNETSAQTAPIVLGDGYRNASVLRSADGNFFAGVVEKVDAAGVVTDVILAFAGAAGPSRPALKPGRGCCRDLRAAAGRPAVSGCGRARDRAFSRRFLHPVRAGPLP